MQNDRLMTPSYFASIVESTDDAVIGKTLDGTIISWNPSAERIFGYKSSEAIGQSILIIVPTERVDEETGILRRIAGGDRVDHFETVRMRKDGTQVQVSVTISPIKDSDGKVIGASKIARYITDRKRAEESLRQMEIRHKTIMDRMLEGCQIIGFDWRYIYLNEAASRHGRREKEELIGKLMWEVYPGIETTAMFRELRKCMEGRKSSRLENEFTFPDGTTGWFLLSMEPVQEGVFVISSDITEERNLRDELRRHESHLEELVARRTADLQETNAELESFSYSVSHDLRAPLRHIDGFVDLLRRSSQSLLDDKGKRYLDIISDSAREMGELIDKLLVFSRMGRTGMKRTVVRTREMVDDVIATIGRDIGERKIRWKIDPLPEIDGDPALLRQVFVNLISNAVKYTGTRAEARIEVKHSRENGDDVFCIRDNGVGFDMKYAGKLFGVFQRLHRQEEFEGMGIGLANVRRIVKRHGGRTWAEGKPDEGAAFYFSIPIESTSSDA